MEPAELASETFTITSNPVIVSNGHVKSKEFLKERASTKLLQEKAVVTLPKNIYGQKAGENLTVSPSQHLCDTIFATPKAHIPRKRQPVTEVPLDEPDTDTNEKVESFILSILAGWLAGWLEKQCTPAIVNHN